MVMEYEGQQRPQRNYTLKVSIHFTSGSQTELLATEFDLDLEAIKSGLAPHRFTYKGVSGDEHPLFIVPNQVAGIVVSESYRN